MSTKRNEALAAASKGGHPTSKARGKRKLSDETNSQPNCVTNGHEDQANKRSERSIAELLSSSQIDSDPVEGQREAKRRYLHRTSAGADSGTMMTGRGLHSDRATVSPRAVSFADMYTFHAKNAALAQHKQNGFVDLTTSRSPPSSLARNGMLGDQKKSTFNPHQAPKKLLVKNLKTVSKEDKNAFFERKWQEQDVALQKLFRNEGSKLLLEELYKGAEHICRQGMSKELYMTLQSKCTEHLDTDLRSTLRAGAESSSGVETLRAFVDMWIVWQRQLQTVRHIFFYLNQTYLLRSAEDPDLELMGLQHFRSIVFQDSVIHQKLLEGTVSLLEQDRLGSITGDDSILAKRAIGTFHDLGVYASDLEPVLITASKAYFKSWRMSDAESADLPHYVRSCSELLERELARCDAWSLDRSTKDQLCALVDEILVDDNVSLLTEEDAVLDMLETNLVKELEQTYMLLQRKGQQQMLGIPFAKFIETEGSVIVFDEKRESDMVVRLLEFKRKLDKLHRISFLDNETMGNTLHKAFEVFMNKTKKTQSTWDTDNAKPGEMIAKHVDLLLKGGSKAVPGLRKAESEKVEEEQDFDNEGDDEVEVEKHLDDALDLFRFVHGKAVFEAFYKKDLARRLLMGRTQSFDAERSMLTRLKNECGAGFTHNLESMFKDMDLAREEMKSYSQLLNDRGIRQVPDLSVNVLSVAAWPTYTDIPVTLPPAISKAQADFEKHYKEKHVGRKLAWKPALAHCQLKSYFPKGNKEIVVSGFQAIVLLLFNDLPEGSKLSYSDIKAATSLPDNELVRTLQSLACAKYRVLTKQPKGRDVNPTDTFTFNSSFTDSKLRIKINQIQLKETKEENKETHQRVAADRHYETQAAIVRIMKARKAVGHNELIVEVIKATRSRGVLDQGEIKKNIEKLIEKEYMERDEEIKNGYRYLA